MVAGHFGIDRVALLAGGEQAEGDPPAELRPALPGRERHLDVVGVDGVFLGEMPDLEAERIPADARGDPSAHADRGPGSTDAFLARLPLLQNLEWAHRAPNTHATPVPPVEAAAGWQLLEGAVQAGLVVDLVRRQMGDDVLDAPAAAVAACRPFPRIEAAQVRAEPPDLPVVDRERVSASWIEWSCACRGLP